MADVLGTDELLVNRDGVTYTQEQQTLMANLEKDDLLLVNRLGQTYTMTGEDLANSIIDPLELTVTLAPTDAYTDVEVTAIPFVTGGKVPDDGFVFTYQWYTADDAIGTNKVEIAGETTENFTPNSIIVGSYFGCEISTTDSLGVEASGESFIGPVSVLEGPPVIFDVTVSEIEDGVNRYTDKEFPYVTTMSLEGEPAPDFELKARLSGTTFNFDVKSDTIIDVAGGGSITCETDEIQSVDDTSDAPNVILTFPSSNGFDCFELGTVVQNPDVKVVSKTDEAPWQITVDGGTWTTSDKLVKETPYDTKLTVSSDQSLDDMSGEAFMSDSTPSGGSYSQTPYKLTTTDIESVDNSDPDNVVLTFPGDVSTNPDLQYFKEGDVVVEGSELSVSPAKGGAFVGGHGQDNTAILLDGTQNPYGGGTLTVPNYLGGGAPNKDTNIITFDPPLTNEGGTIWVNCFRQTNAGEIRINVGLPGEKAIASTNNNSWAYVDTGVDTVTNFQMMRPIAGSAIVSGVQFFSTTNSNTGRFSSDTNKITEVKAVSTGYPDSNTMVVDGGTWLAGDSIEYQTNGGQGDIVSVNANDNTITLSDTGNRDNRWIAINSGEGSGVSKDFSVVPVNGTVVEQDFAWCKLQIIDDKAQVTGIQGTEPGFLPVTSKDYSIKFPAVFPTGNTPDEDIPRGTCIAAIVAAENNAGRSEKESNCFMPADVVGEGVAGPIIDSNSSTLVVGSSANLDTFSSGDNLVMCGFTGDLAEYTMRTTDIESVSEQIGLSIDASQMWSNPANFLNTPPTPTYPLSNAFDNSTLILYGNSLQTELPYPGSIVFIPPVPMSGDIYLVGGSDATYPEPAVLVNDETEALERITNVTDIGAYDWKIYRFVHSGPVNKITIVAKSQYDGTTGVKEVLIASLGVGYRWLIDSNQPNQEHTEVTPSTFEGIGRNDLQLTFPGLPSTNPDLKFFRQGDAIVDYQVWSSYGNGQTNGAYPQTLMFDGRVTDYNECCVPGSSAFVWEYPPGIPFETIEIAGIGKDQEVYINDQLVQNTNEFNIWQTNAKCVTITPQFTGNIGSKLYKIQLPAWQTGAAIAGIKLDGNWLIDDTRTPVKVVSTGWPESNTMVVDGGNWTVNDGTVNSDEIWSVNSSWTGSAPAADQAADKGFNGSTSYTDGYFYAVQGGTQTVLFNNLEFTTLELWTWNHAAANGELTVNGVSLTQAINDDPNTEEFFDGGFKFDATSLVTSPLTNITAAKLLSPTSGGFTAVFVDGKMLVDTDQAGMSFAEFGPVAGRANFVSTNGTDEVILLNSNDRWIDSSNRLGENFYFRDSITALDASNPKHVALQQEIAEAFAAFPEKVNERRTAIASSFYRLMGGEELTTAEFELLEETVTNAVNATEPFALDGYYPLYYTAAKADDASSLDSHHTHTINGIDYYMPDGGTLYHGNYITPD